MSLFIFCISIISLDIFHAEVVKTHNVSVMYF